MIAHLKGKVIYKDLRFAVIEAGGVGYKVFVTTSLLDKLDVETETEIWTHQAVREDSVSLYGFSSMEELNFFELLISISGIGPKTALSILNISSIQNLRRAVASGDTSHLTKVSGIGRKIAEKIVLELKDKIKDFGSEEGSELGDEIDVLEALKAIGYREQDAREAMKSISGKTTSTGEKVKMALKILAKQSR